MVLSHNVSLSTKDTRVLVWISSDNVKAVVEKGFKVIHAASDYFYLVRPRFALRYSSHCPSLTRICLVFSGLRSRRVGR